MKKLKFRNRVWESTPHLYLYLLGGIFISLLRCSHSTIMLGDRELKI